MVLPSTRMLRLRGHEQECSDRYRSTATQPITPALFTTTQPTTPALLTTQPTTPALLTTAMFTVRALLRGTQHRVCQDEHPESVYVDSRYNVATSHSCYSVEIRSVVRQTHRSRTTQSQTTAWPSASPSPRAPARAARCPAAPSTRPWASAFQSWRVSAKTAAHKAGHQIPVLLAVRCVPAHRISFDVPLLCLVNIHPSRRRLPPPANPSPNPNPRFVHAGCPDLLHWPIRWRRPRGRRVHSHIDGRTRGCAHDGIRKLACQLLKAQLRSRRVQLHVFA